MFMYNVDYTLLFMELWMNGWIFLQKKIIIMGDGET